MKTKGLILLLAVALWLNGIQTASACSCFIVTKGASTDGSVFMTYNFDMHTHYGELYHYPAMDHAPGAMVDIYEWDTGKFLGQIPQVSHTYEVIGNMNEFQVAMNETTYGGRGLNDTTGIMDYGAMIFITLQRAKTAREAIKIMTGLANEYGYYSSGETYTVMDKEEVWVVDFIGKGTKLNKKGVNVNKGAVWVARKVPDGYVCAHANQARITTFPLNDPENCMYAPDVISFAKEMGYYPEDGKDEDFSFADAYAPLSFGSLRFCEARVWSMFRRVNGDMEQYEPYALGESAEKRMPLFIKPDKKLSVADVMAINRDHYQGTVMDMTQDVGAGPYKLPYRWRPMTWEHDGEQYLHERAISTQQTAFSSIAQARNWLPDAIGGVLWFGADDTYSTIYTPMYCGIRAIPESFEVRENGLYNFSYNSLFWMNSLVTNLAYTRYDIIIKDVQKVQSELEGKYINYQPAVDKAAQLLYENDPELAREFLTDYCVNMGQNTTTRLKELAEFLFVKYMDGNIKHEKNGRFIPNDHGFIKFPSQPGYDKRFYEEIVKECGEQKKMKTLPGETDH